MLPSVRRAPSAFKNIVVRPASLTNRFASLACRRSIPSRLPTFSRLPAVACYHTTPRLWQAGAAQQAASNSSQSSGPITVFDDLRTKGLVHENIVKAVTQDMKLTTMTEVQSQTINAALQGEDMIAQAKTGTGKTLAFLIPTLQRIVEQDPDLAYRGRGRRPRADDIRAIIVSPTRELAEQIAAEAVRVTRHTGMVTQIAVGGTQKATHLRKMQYEGCHLLVGTPGRLNDIFSDNYSGVKAPNLDCFVMDEADRLLDAGFTQEILSIKEHLPREEDRTRQNLMFSATVPRDVIRMVRQTLRPGFQFVQCVREDEVPTHEKVPQKYVAASGLENVTPALVEIFQNAITEQRNSNGQGREFKAIVYCNTKAEVTLVYEALDTIRHQFKPARLMYIHSGNTQSGRTATAQRFREASSAILISSDVTARGMDFPNVSHVVQLGSPRSREDYIHRIGRTGRAGKEGEAWIVIPDLEKAKARETLRDLPIVKVDNIESARVNMSQPAEVTGRVASILTDVTHAFKEVDPSAKRDAYKSYFGIYGSLSNKQAVADAINDLSKYGWGMEAPPIVSPALMAKIGFNRVQGLNIGREESTFGDGFGSRDNFSRGRSSFGGDRGGRGFGDDRGRGFGDDRGGRGFQRDSGRTFGGRGFGGNDRSGGGFGKNTNRRDSGFGSSPESRNFRSRQTSAFD